MFAFDLDCQSDFDILVISWSILKLELCRWDTSPFTVTVMATWCAAILVALDLWLWHIDMHWPGTSWDRFKTSHLAKLCQAVDPHFVSCVRWPWRYLGCHNWCCIGWTTGRSCDVVGYVYVVDNWSCRCRCEAGEAPCFSFFSCSISNS